MRQIVVMIVLTAVLALVAGVQAGEDAAVHATWKATDVATIAQRLGSIAGVPVVVDRRIDPTTRIDLEGGGRRADLVLAELARAAGGELAVLRHSLRISPSDRVRRVADADGARTSRLATLPSKVRESLESSKPLAWEAGTPPRELVARLAEEAGIPIDGADTIPHDHLPACSLPAIPLADRLDLVLAHYDLRIDPQGRGRRGLRIVPLDEPTVASVVASRHDRAADREGRGTATATPVDRYTLRAEAPLEQLLRTLADRFGLSLQLDRESLAAKGVAADEIVRLAVEDAPRSQLLDAVTKPLSLSWTVDDGTLKVR